MVEERVQKIISNCGYCSRRKAEKLIEDGLVKVNGSVISLGDKADISVDKVEVEGKPLRKNQKEYYLLNKPKHTICTLYDPGKRKLVTSLIRTKARIYTVGRLDELTTGLIILTNDGDFSNFVMHPRYDHKKTYYVKLDAPIKEFDVTKIEKGLKLKEYETAPCTIEMISENELNITLSEGKNKEIKNIFWSMGYGILELHRLSIGPLKLGNLKVGEYRSLTKDEIKMFMRNKK